MRGNIDDISKSTWEGTFRVCGVDVHCHVLSDGRRIIEADSMNALLEALANGTEAESGDLDAFARWQRGGERENTIPNPA